MGSVLAFLVVALGGAVSALILVAAWAMQFPDNAEKVYGWIAGAVSKLYRKADRTAVAYKVQGEINSAGTALTKNGPAELLEKKLKIKWADADQAATLIKEGEVLVVMQPSRHHEENVAHALMAYLPKAMLPRARPYLDQERMRAADLIIAKSVLSQEEAAEGALPVFFEKHLDPARGESEALKDKIRELDEIDLQGWLARVLLAEYRLLGDQLHPGEPEDSCPRDAEEFAAWLYRLAARKPGDTVTNLTYTGRYFRVAVIWVGIRDRMAEEGFRPYRKRARRHLFRDKFDAVYLMARDDNIPFLEELADELESDAWVASVARYVYPLRSDFKKRKLHRDRGMIVCARPRRAGEEPPPEAEEDADDGLPEEERFEPTFSHDDVPAGLSASVNGSAEPEPPRMK